METTLACIFYFVNHQKNYKFTAAIKHKMQLLILQIWIHNKKIYRLSALLGLILACLWYLHKKVAGNYTIINNANPAVTIKTCTIKSLSDVLHFSETSM